MTPNNLLMFLTLTGIFEPSAIQQLPDGRFLVVEDEKSHPFSLLEIDSAGKVSSVSLRPGLLEFNDDFWKLDDLEGVALDRLGHIYALTSHSRNNSGEEKKSRDKLVRFRIEGDSVVEPLVVKGLKPALMAAHPVLATAAGILDVKNDGGLNIEALEISPNGHGGHARFPHPDPLPGGSPLPNPPPQAGEGAMVKGDGYDLGDAGSLREVHANQQHLLIGFRSPLLDGLAIIARLENPAAIFDAGEPPRISAALVTLDLGGDGIRGMAYLPALGGYLLISGPVAREQVQFKLWFWRGGTGDPARKVSVPGLQGFEHAEGVSPAVIGGRQRIIFVSDDGSRKEGRFARFILLDPEQLQIAP